MSDDNNTATAEPAARRGRPPKAKPKVRSGELLSRMNSASILLLRAQRSDNPDVVKELLAAALETLKGDAAEG